MEIVAPSNNDILGHYFLHHILNSRLKMQFQKKLCCKLFKVIKVVNFDADVLFFQIQP